MIGSTTEQDCDDPFQEERDRLHNAIQKLARKSKNLQRKINDLQRRIAIDTNGAFVTMKQSDLKALLEQAFADTIDAHGNVVEGFWRLSFRKRFWGRVKNLAHNKQAGLVE